MIPDAQRLRPAMWPELIRNGNRLFVGSNAAVPLALMEEFLRHVEQFRDLEIVHILTLGETPWTAPSYLPHLRTNSLFLGAGTREAVRLGHADYTPCFLSEIPELFRSKVLPVDVALVQVGPPDAQGYCSLGVSVDVVAAACASARHIIAQMNARSPRTMGQSFIHLNHIDAIFECETPLPEIPPPTLDAVTLQIGQYVAQLIEDGSTLQMGIGKIPDAVLRYLDQHNDLGVHTEMFSDGIIACLERGTINNRKKTLHPGKTVASFCIGTRTLYEYVDENPHIDFYPSDYVNNPQVIAQHHRMIAINSALEVDLTGQVVSDSVGYRFYSGIGGQVDFIRGAAMSRGGKPIIKR